MGRNAYDPTASRRYGRRGLTIIEMLVAMALVIFMMAIMSEAFVHGLEAFRRLKAIADMDEQLRNASILLRDDLARPHFGFDERLSDPNFYDPARRPHLGFFSYSEGPPNLPTSTWEGSDQFNLPSFRDGNDTLSFTIRGDRHRRQGWYRTNLPPGSPLDDAGNPASRYDTGAGLYSSQWAHVIWFLVPDGGRVTASDDPASPPPLPLYNLHRQQLVIVADQDVTAPGGHVSALATHQFPAYDLSSRPSTGGLVIFNSPAEVQFRQWRWGGRPSVPNSGWFPEAYFPAYPNGPYLPFGSTAQGTGLGSMYALSALRTGGDLVMTNVLSMDVKVWDPRAIVSPGSPGGFRGYFVDLGHGTPDTTFNRQAWGLLPSEAINNTPFEANPLTGAFFFGVGDQPNASHVDDNNLRAPAPYLQRTYDTMSARDAVVYNPGTGAYNSLFAGSAGLYSADGFNPVHRVNPALPYQPDVNQPGYNPAKKIYPVPYRVPIQMIQIQLRVWDVKTKQTRQVTIVQDT